MKNSEACCPEEESVAGEESADDTESDLGVAEVSDFFIEVGAGGDECETIEHEAAWGDELEVAVEQLSDDDDAAGNERYCEVDEYAVGGG